MSSSTLKITLKRSMNRRTKAQTACVRGLGLRKIGQTVVVDNTPENRGMAQSVYFMLHVEEAE